MPGPRDLEASFTLKDEVSGPLKVIEANTKKATDAMAREEEKRIKARQAAIKGFLSVVGVLGLLKKISDEIPELKLFKENFWTTLVSSVTSFYEVLNKIPLYGKAKQAVEDFYNEGAIEIRKTDLIKQRDLIRSLLDDPNLEKKFASRVGEGFFSEESLNANLRKSFEALEKESTKGIAREAINKFFINSFGLKNEAAARLSTQVAAALSTATEAAVVSPLQKASDDAKKLLEAFESTLQDDLKINLLRQITGDKSDEDDYKRKLKLIEDVFDKSFKAAKIDATTASLALFTEQIGLGAEFGKNLAESLKEIKDEDLQIALQQAEAAERLLNLRPNKPKKRQDEATFLEGFDSVVKELQDEFFKIEQIGKKTAESLHSSFSDGFFTLFENGFKNGADAAKLAFESIRSSANRLLSDLISTGLLSLLKSLISNFAGGGGIGLPDPTAERYFGTGDLPDFGGGVGAVSSSGLFGGSPGIVGGSAASTSSAGLFGGLVGGAPIIVNYAPSVTAIDERGTAEFFRRSKDHLMAQIGEQVGRSARDQRRIRGR